MTKATRQYCTVQYRKSRERNLKNTNVKCALFIVRQNGKLGEECEDIWHVQAQDKNSGQSSGRVAGRWTAQLWSSWIAWLCRQHTERCTRTIYPSFHLSSVYLCICLSVLFTYLFMYSSMYLRIYLSISLSTNLSVDLSVCLSRIMENWGTFAKTFGTFRWETASAAECSQFL